jgi:hypothetical protein
VKIAVVFGLLCGAFVLDPRIAVMEGTLAVVVIWASRVARR